MAMIQKTFEALTKLELYRILQLRIEVFVVEQECSYQDIDAKDIDAIHLYEEQHGDILSYVRVHSPGISYLNYSSMSRVVTEQSARGKGLSRKLIKKGIEILKEKYPHHSIKISAQTYLEEWYQTIGFIPVGEAYLEDGIPHLGMLYK